MCVLILLLLVLMCVCVCVCVDSLQEVMCREFSVQQGAECRLWMKSSDTSCERLRNVHVSVLDACLTSGMVGSRPLTSTGLTTCCLEITCACVRVCVFQTVIMEMRNADGTWPSSKPQIM